MARFRNLDYRVNYDIIDGKSGYWQTQGIQGADAMASDQEWNIGDEAWPAGTTDFDGKPVEVAQVGDRVEYPNENDETDGRCWDDAARILRGRSMCLHDDGSGYVAAWRYAADGSWLDTLWPQDAETE